MGTTRIVYTGPSVGVEIAETGQWAAKGAEVEVDSDLAASLLEQDVWARPTAKAAKTAHKQGRVAKDAIADAAPAEPITPEEG